MPHSHETLEPQLKKFLRKATIAHAEGGMVEFVPPQNDKGAIFDADGFTIVDVWDESTDGRVYNGSESVSQDGELVWKAGYHGVIDESADPDIVLEIYSRALKRPAPDLPIRGPRILERKGYLYGLESIRGPLSIARFVVNEHIYIPETGKRIYDGHIVGGYIDVDGGTEN